MLVTYTFEQLARTLDFSHYKISSDPDSFSPLSEYYDSDWLLYRGSTQNPTQISYSGGIITANYANIFGYWAIPIQRKIVKGFTFELKGGAKTSSLYWIGIALSLCGDGKGSFPYLYKETSRGAIPTSYISKTINASAQAGYVDHIMISVDGNIATYIKDLKIIVAEPDWNAVERITGNSKTYTLAKIASASINDGESVAGATSSNFDVLTDVSLVSKMIEDVLPTTADKVIVQYTIPSGTYSYIKLVYKKGSIPTSYTDGTAIDILQTDTESEISGIADGDTYWFVIFTDKTTSEPECITTTDLTGD